MILAILSDVHGNAAALRAVLSELPTVDGVLCAGDLIGYYPDPSEVLDRLRALETVAVRGNHERMLCRQLPVPTERAEYYRIEWTRDALSAEQQRWLCALPPALEVEHDGLRLVMRHANPWDEDTYIYPDSPALERIKLPAASWLILGHTHYPMQVQRGDGWVVNPGSVGQPRDWDPRAAYALLDTSSGKWQQRRVRYDHEGYQRRLEAMGWHPHTVAVLGRVRATRADT